MGNGRAGHYYFDWIDESSSAVHGDVELLISMDLDTSIEKFAPSFHQRPFSSLHPPNPTFLLLEKIQRHRHLRVLEIPTDRCWNMLQHVAEWQSGCVKTTPQCGKTGGKWGYKWPICILSASQSIKFIINCRISGVAVIHVPEKGRPSLISVHLRQGAD